MQLAQNVSSNIDLGGKKKVQQREFLCDLIINQLLRFNDPLPYCALCGCEKEKKERKSHVIMRCTLDNMKKESGGHVFYSRFHHQPISTEGAIWYMLCKRCEQANDLNTAEERIELLRRKCREHFDQDILVKEESASLLHFAAVFILYRGIMVNIDLLEELHKPNSRALFSTFYSVKEYCRKPVLPPPVDIYLFTLPFSDISKYVYKYLSRDVTQRVPALLDPYMRRIELTHVATTKQTSFFYTCFDGLHLITPISGGDALKELMLKHYPKDDDRYHPELAFHCHDTSPYLILRNRKSKASFFPPFLYLLSFEGADKWKDYYECDEDFHLHAKLTLNPTRGFLYEHREQQGVHNEPGKPETLKLSDEAEEEENVLDFDEFIKRYEVIHDV